MNDTREQKSLQLLELITEKIKEIPRYENNYADFKHEFSNKSSQILKEIICDHKNGLKLDFNDEQDGILFSFFDEKEEERVPILYEGTVWSDETKKNQFYALFNLFKELKFKTTIVDFLLYEKQLLLPSKLIIISIDKEKYTSNCSYFRNLSLPILKLNDEFYKIENELKEIKEKVTYTKNKQEICLKYGKHTYTLTNEDLDNFNKCCNHLTAQIDNNLLETIKNNFKAAGIVLPNNIDNKLKGAIVMHTLSKYARNLLIFSSGTYNNVSGLIFTAKVTEDKNSNWNKIKSFSNELLYLDGALRQISVFEIRNQETILRENFLNDYKKRSKDYEVLGKIVIAILSSLDNLYNEKIHNITMRIKSAEKLLEKINSKYREYYEQGNFEKLYYEEKEENATIVDLKQVSEQAKMGDISKNVITDLCGARVIFNYKDEIKTFIKKLNQYFNCYEYDNKEKGNIEKGKFRAYTSQHFILSLNKDAIDFFVANVEKTETNSNNKNLWENKLKSMVFELQLRTLFEHGWADANHDLVYKADQKELEEMTGDQQKKWEDIKDNIDKADIMLSSLKKDIISN